MLAPTNSSTDVIITMLGNLGMGVGTRFARSLRETGAGCRLVVLLPATDSSRALASTLAEWNVWPHYYQVGKTARESSYKIVRYQAALDYLRREYASHYRARVMLCDSRDVIFQRDPFTIAADPARPLDVFMEDYFRTFSNSKINQGHVIPCFGQDAVDRVFLRPPQPVSCSGVTMGSFSAVVRATLDRRHRARTRHEANLATPHACRCTICSGCGTRCDDPSIARRTSLPPPLMPPLHTWACKRSQLVDACAFFRTHLRCDAMLARAHYYTGVVMRRMRRDATIALRGDACEATLAWRRKAQSASRTSACDLSARTLCAAACNTTRRSTTGCSSRESSARCACSRTKRGRSPRSAGQSTCIVIDTAACSTVAAMLLTSSTSTIGANSYASA